MEGTTGDNPSSPPPPPSAAVNGGGGGGGASKYLSNLPSRGCFSSSSSSSTTVPSSNLGGMRVYICDRDTSPPEDQHIKTNQMNILIRSLLLKKQNHKNDVAKSNNSNQNESSGGTSSRKRGPAAAAEIVRAKRAATEVEADMLQSLTVERLRAMLKEKGFSLKGKKDELIARLRSAT